MCGAGPIRGEGVEIAHQIWDLVVCEIFATKIFEFVGGHDRALDGKDAGANQLPEHFVGNTDDAGIAHPLVQVKDVLDLPRRYTVPGSEDQFRPAAENPVGPQREE